MSMRQEPSLPPMMSAGAPRSYRWRVPPTMGYSPVPPAQVGSISSEKQSQTWLCFSSLERGLLRQPLSGSPRASNRASPLRSLDIWTIPMTLRHRTSWLHFPAWSARRGGGPAWTFLCSSSIRRAGTILSRLRYSTETALFVGIVESDRDRDPITYGFDFTGHQSFWGN